MRGRWTRLVGRPRGNSAEAVPVGHAPSSVSPVPGAPTRGNTGRAFRIAILAAASIRLVIASSTFGTNDALIWTQLADLINENGLVDVYALTPYMNHPPLPALYMAGARAWATSVEIPFAFALKLPALVGDGLSATAIYLAQRSATNVQRARRSVMWFLFNPAVIALSAFHGNTDSFYAGLIALAVTLLWRRPATAGLLVAAALNIKLLPLVLVPAVLVAMPTSGRRRFAGGLTVGIVPFVALAAIAPWSVERILGYSPVRETWGLAGLARIHPDLQSFSDSATIHGRWLLAVATIVVAVTVWKRGVSPARAALMAHVAFLVVMPGFGIQYFALLIPLGMLVRVRHQAWLVASASAFVVVLYVTKLQDFWPANAVYDDPIPVVAAIFGYIAWAVMVWFVFAGWSEPPSRQRRPLSEFDADHTGAPALT